MLWWSHFNKWVIYSLAWHTLLNFLCIITISVLCSPGVKYAWLLLNCLYRHTHPTHLRYTPPSFAACLVFPTIRSPNSLFAVVDGTACKFCMGVSSHCHSSTTPYIHPLPFSQPFKHSFTNNHTHTCTRPSPSLSEPYHPLSCLPPSLSALGWHVMVALVCFLPLPLVY